MAAFCHLMSRTLTALQCLCPVVQPHLAIAAQCPPEVTPAVWHCPSPSSSILPVLGPDPPGCLWGKEGKLLLLSPVRFSCHVTKAQGSQCGSLLEALDIFL